MFCQVYLNIFNWNQGINELKRVYLSSCSKICIFFFLSFLSFFDYILRHLCVLPNFPLSFRKLALQSQLMTLSLLEKWHTYPRDCKLAEIDCRVLEISKLAYLVITFYSENSNKKKRKMCFYTSPGYIYPLREWKRSRKCTFSRQWSRISLINSSSRAVKIDYKQVLINCFWLCSLDF